MLVNVCGWHALKLVTTVYSVHCTIQQPSGMVYSIVLTPFVTAYFTLATKMSAAAADQCKQLEAPLYALISARVGLICIMQHRSISCYNFAFLHHCCCSLLVNTSTPFTITILHLDKKKSIGQYRTIRNGCHLHHFCSFSLKGQ